MGNNNFFYSSKNHIVRLIAYIGFLLGLLGCLRAEEDAPLRIWVVKSKPFPGSNRVEIPKLQLQGYCTAAPILHFDKIDSVATSESMVKFAKIDNDGVLREEEPKKHYWVSIKLDEMQARLLVTLMKINSGERLLLRRGKDPVAAFQILKLRSIDGTLAVGLRDSNQEGIPFGRSVDSGEIEIPFSNAEEAKALRVELWKIAKVGPEIQSGELNKMLDNLLPKPSRDDLFRYIP